MNKKQINTKPMSGFMELTPADQISFDKMREVIETIYSQFGFVSIDTPVMERKNILLAKAGGETAKQIYQFKKGEEDIALRFDLTIPLARYVVEHCSQLVFPFRRRHIAKVYRGERPQKGRYREFYQADIDVIGDGKLSLMNDAEIPSIIYSIFRKLDFGPFIIRLNNRKLINGLMIELGINDPSMDVMRIIDKIDKIGDVAAKESLLNLKIAPEKIEKIFSFLNIKGKTDEVISALHALSFKNNLFKVGVSELEEVVNNIRLIGVPEDYYVIDLSIARGLDYYTGTVYETTLVNYPNIGSVCSGGRYDNLADAYTDRKLPGVGISIGLTRLFFQLKEVGLITAESATTTKVLVVPMINNCVLPLKVANTLREEGLSAEVYFEKDKIAKILKYGDRIGVPFVILIGENEVSEDNVTLKNMRTGEQSKIKITNMCEYIKKELQDNM
jgi:histidyl-tRNA synthetase